MKDNYQTLRKLMNERQEIQERLDDTIKSIRESIDARKQFDRDDLERQAAQRDQTTIKGRKVA